MRLMKVYQEFDKLQSSLEIDSQERYDYSAWNETKFVDNAIKHACNNKSL